MGTALGLLLALGATSGAQAGLFIEANGAPQDVIDDLGGNVPPAGLPLGLSGYQSSVADHAPNLVAQDTSTYKFTYLGSGDATRVNQFKIGTTVVFDTSTSSVGDTFLIHLTSGEIDFSYVANVGGTPVTLHNSASDPGATFFLGLDGSTHCISADPSATCDGVSDALTGSPFDLFKTAFIGLSDRPFADETDHDFQDLGVRVDEVPEPATLALFGAGLAAFGVLRRRRKS